MGTYEIKQVLADYENGTLTAQMATGHGLQHIRKLYDAQTAASISHYELRGKLRFQPRRTVFRKPVTSDTRCRFSFCMIGGIGGLGKIRATDGGLSFPD